MSEIAGRVLMIPKGTYSPTTTYDPLDAVKYEQNSYVCKQTSRGNLPTNTTYWQPLTDVTADEIPTEGSTNLVQSGGVYSALTTINQTLTKQITVNGAVNELDHTGVTDTSGTVKFTVNDDKTITVSASSYPVTLSSTTTFFFYGSSSAAVPNIFKGRKLTGCPSGGATAKYKIVAQEFSSATPSGAVAESSDVGEGANISNGDYIRMYIRLGSGYQLTSALTFKPMISLPELGLSYDDYVPYAKTNQELTAENQTLTSAFMNNINQNGCKNILFSATLNDLVKCNTIGTWHNNQYTVNDITFEFDFDGSVLRKIYANGTASATVSLMFSDRRKTADIGKEYYNILSQNNYSVKETPSGVRFAVDLYNDTTWLRGWNNTNGKIQIALDYSGANVVEPYVFIPIGTTLNNVAIYPMICLTTDYALDPTYVPPAKTNKELTDDVNGLLNDGKQYNFGIMGTNTKPSFLNGSILANKTILEIFSALPINSVGESYGPFAIGSEISVATYSGTNTLFSDIMSLTGLTSMTAGLLTIKKIEAQRGLVIYNTGNKIFNCRIINNALETCYLMELTPIT